MSSIPPHNLGYVLHGEVIKLYVYRIFSGCGVIIKTQDVT